MHTCSIHVTTYALSCNMKICCSGSLGDLWARLGCLTAKLLVCTEEFRANPTARRGPSSSSSTSPGLPVPWCERVVAASPGVPCRLPAAGYHCARGSDPQGEGWARLRGHGLGPPSDLMPVLTQSRDQAAASELEGSSYRSPRLAGYTSNHALSNWLVLVSFSSTSIRLANVQQNFFFIFKRQSTCYFHICLIKLHT